MLQAIPSSWAEYVAWDAAHRRDRRCFRDAWDAVDAEFAACNVPFKRVLVRMAVMQGPFTRDDVQDTPDEVLLGVYDIGPRRLAFLRCLGRSVGADVWRVDDAGAAACWVGEGTLT